MAKFSVIDRNGRRKEVGDDYLLADGESISVNMTMMDAARRTASDKAFDARSLRLENAWRDKKPDEEEPDDDDEDDEDDDDEDGITDSEAAYDARSRRLSDAWCGLQARRTRRIKAIGADAAYSEHSAWLQRAYKGGR